MNRSRKPSIKLVDPADPQRFERVLDVFADVIEVTPQDRSARLNELAGSDPPLLAAVLELLANAEAADKAGFLDTTSDESLPNTSAESRREQAPERIGPFSVLGKLGEGGTGVVYLAESPPPIRRRVAVKLYKASLSDRTAARSAIEAEVLASFNHPGIAQVFETGELGNGQRWTACELVEGTWISKNAASYGWRAGVELLIQAAEAIHHAHQRGVIHRDLKPSNLLVVEDESSLRVKVIDFGVARILTDRGVDEGVTEPGLLVGTLAYMSPEQLASKEVDARTDVYGLGLVACEMLSGKLPVGRRGGLAELTQSATDPVSIRLAGCGGHERDLEAIIAKATAPTPALRYPSMQHFADDLRRVLDNEPILARKTGLLDRLRLYISRHPRRAAVSMLVTIVIVVLAAGLVVSRNQLADEVLDQRKLTHELVTDTLTGLREVRGTAQQREAMVGALLERHTRRFNENPEDPDLASLQARLLRERGDIAASLGEYDSAEEDLAASRDVYERLWAERFGGVEIGRLYAESIVRTGDVLMERDRAQSIPEVLSIYRHAMAVQEDLLRVYPDHISLLDDLCWSYDRIVGVGDKWKVTPDAELEAWLAKRVELSEELLSRDPDRTLSQYNLGTAHLRFAQYLGARERNIESAAAVAQGLPYAWAAVRAEPERTMYVQTLIGMLTWEANALMTRGEVEQVPAAIDRLVDTARSQARLSPGDLLAENLCISILVQAAETLEEIGRTDSAKGYAGEALERLRTFRNLISAGRMQEVDRAEERLVRLIERLG